MSFIIQRRVLSGALIKPQNLQIISVSFLIIHYQSWHCGWTLSVTVNRDTWRPSCIISVSGEIHYSCIQMRWFYLPNKTGSLVTGRSKKIILVFVLPRFLEAFLNKRANSPVKLEHNDSSLSHNVQPVLYTRSFSRMACCWKGLSILPFSLHLKSWRLSIVSQQSKIWSSPQVLNSSLFFNDKQGQISTWNTKVWTL